MSAGTDPSQSAIAPPPVPSDVGIVAAMPIEVAPLIARLADLRRYNAGRSQVVEGLCGGKVVTLITTGPGQAAARAGAELLHAGHRPRLLISAGFAGALDPSWNLFDLSRPTRLCDANGWNRSVVPIAVVETERSPIRSGQLVTVDAIVRTAAEKAELRSRTGADLVDMETAAVARFAEERGLRFLPIRIISDVATTDLPPEVLTIMGPNGSYRLGATLGALWRRPAGLKDLLVLREHALEAARRLGDFIARTLRQIP